MFYTVGCMESQAWGGIEVKKRSIEFTNKDSAMKWVGSWFVISVISAKMQFHAAECVAVEFLPA